MPSEKQTEALADQGLSIGDRRNLAYKGTVVTYGRGTGVVIATGMQTELGRIATLLQGEEEGKTPLQKRLVAFGKRLAFAILAICAVVFVFGVLRGEAPLLMLLTAISLAVAAIPEALPAVITISLALGAKKMVRQSALVRKLAAEGGFAKTEMEKRYPRLAELPFDSERKLMTTFHAWEGGKVVSFTKGAVEVVLERATRVLAAAGEVDLAPAEMPGVADRIAADGLRALGFGMRVWDRLPDDPAAAGAETGHVLAIRSDSESLFSQGLFSNKPLVGAFLLTLGLQLATIYVPFLNPIFKTEPLTLGELGFTLAMSSVVFIAVEIEKHFKRRRDTGMLGAVGEKGVS